MPATSRILVKASLVYLGIGGRPRRPAARQPLGSARRLDSAPENQPRSGPARRLADATHHGRSLVAFPPLPRRADPDASQRVRRGQVQRGSELLFWATFASLNAGILLRAVCEPLYGWTRIAAYQVLSDLSGLLLLAAVAFFVSNVWGRIRELRQARS